MCVRTRVCDSFVIDMSRVIPTYFFDAVDKSEYEWMVTVFSTVFANGLGDWLCIKYVYVCDRVNVIGKVC